MDAGDLMRWLGRIRNIAHRLKGKRGMQYIEWSDLDRAAAAFQIALGAEGSPWDEFRGKYLPLPDWFRGDLGKV